MVELRLVAKAVGVYTAFVFTATSSKSLAS